MLATRSHDPLAGVEVDSAPLIGPRGEGGNEVEWRPSRRPSLMGAARFLHRASSRRMMRGPSMLVRETAAEQLEERQSDWAYSGPVVFLDILWNLAFIVVAAGVLFISMDETPTMPLRLWIVGYAVQCMLHIICVCVEYRRRHPRRRYNGGGRLEVGSQGGSGPSSPRDLQEGGGGSRNYDLEQSQFEGGTKRIKIFGECFSTSTAVQLVVKKGKMQVFVAFNPLSIYSWSIAKHLESANTMFSFIWWIIGFYWVSAGGQVLTHQAPQLYWVCIVFLAFDVFFVVFCVALACIIGIAVCCCLPCIIALLYAVADQEGASEEDIRNLPKFKFQRTGDFEKFVEISRSLGGVMTECGDPHNEIALSYDDAECCICLSAYADGVKLRQLPCGHHFHCSCIDKWLQMNATCPLCKYNIIKCSNSSSEYV